MSGARAEVQPLRTPRLELVPLTEEVLGALLLGDRSRAEALGGLLLPAGWPPPEDTGFLLSRLAGMRDAPAHRGWLLRAMVLRDSRQLVGHLGFHAPPDAQGTLEVGYEVLAPWRRQGLAHEAVEALLTWATAAHGITRFLASVAPDNAASLRLLERLGFRWTGAMRGHERVLALRRDAPAGRG